jgi:hypothetical protein
VSPVTSIVHWVSCSFLGNHDKITIKGNWAVAGLKFFVFLGLFGSKIALSPVTESKIVHSQAHVTRHLNLWSKHYSILLGDDASLTPQPVPNTIESFVASSTADKSALIRALLPFIGICLSPSTFPFRSPPSTPSSWLPVW